MDPFCHILLRFGATSCSAYHAFSDNTFNAQYKMKALEIVEKATDAILTRNFHQVCDNASFSGFLVHPKDQGIQLKTCTPILDGVLMKLDGNCICLNFLLVHGGCC
ncbi:unnamed protein product [Fraxinus pennsylvanica]|uniref:Uncharacterized protein n=1 Tax=Fraxinus pennsylvanica TaxID=56036 RepID=A0AAD2DPJ1_9LAMI|nr:unnamed protein product [Fraxinus pennsylvanica]